MLTLRLQEQQQQQQPSVLKPSNSVAADPERTSQCLPALACLSFFFFVPSARRFSTGESPAASLGVDEEEEGGWRSVASVSCVLGLADVVGRHVAPAALCLAQPPLAVAVHVLELQDPQLLVGGDAQLVGTAGVEGVKGVVNLAGEAERANTLGPFGSTLVSK